MKTVKVTLTFILAVIVYFSALTQVLASKKVALVIGNSAYKHTYVLKNPKNDAIDMAEAFSKIGFHVILGTDLNKLQTAQIIRKFSKELQNADIGVFYYAGHGLQVDGTNYIIPVEAKLTDKNSLFFDAVKLSFMQKVMENSSKTNVIFLDACRDNPLTRNLARAMGTRSTSIGRGLAQAEAGLGTLISFATQPGNVALDGKGRNSPYTKALKKRILEPNTDLLTVLIKVRNDVIRSTGQKQVPWDQHALTASLVLNPQASKNIVSNENGTRNETIHALQQAPRINQRKKNDRLEATPKTTIKSNPVKLMRVGPDGIVLNNQKIQYPPSKKTKLSILKVTQQKDTRSAKDGLTQTAGVSVTAPKNVTITDKVTTPKNPVTAKTHYVIQVAARRNHKQAIALATSLHEKYSDFLGKYSPLIQHADLSTQGKGIWFRVEFGTMKSREEAQTTCEMLKTTGLKSCFVKSLWK